MSTAQSWGDLGITQHKNVIGQRASVGTPATQELTLLRALALPATSYHQAALGIDWRLHFSQNQPSVSNRYRQIQYQHRWEPNLTTRLDLEADLEVPQRYWVVGLIQVQESAKISRYVSCTILNVYVCDSSIPDSPCYSHNPRRSRMHPIDLLEHAVNIGALSLTVYFIPTIIFNHPGPSTTSIN